MFKRTKNFTSLIMAITSISTLIPSSAIAADYTKVSDEEGTIYKAVAYKDGKFYIDGEPKKQDEAVYYFNAGKYSKLKDLDNDDDIALYGTKYVNIEEGDNFFDLSTGKVSDDKIDEEALDKATENLRKKVKSDNDGRYEENDSKNYKTLEEIPNVKYGEPYYKTTYNAKTGKKSVNGGANGFIVYTDAAGKYVDADHNLGTVKVELDGGKSVKVENTSDDDNDIRVNVYDTKEIGQDSNYVYRIAMMCVDASDTGKAIKQINGVEIEANSDFFQIESDGKKIDFKVIQAISKTQASGDVDGIKYAKTVHNYFVADKDGDAVKFLNEDEKNFSVVKGNKIVNYNVDSSDLSVQVLELQSKGSIYYLEAEDGEELELNDGETSFDIDVEGNLWGISEDYIYKFDNKSEWDKKYKINDDFVSLSVYDEKNIAAWSEEDEVYSIIYSASTAKDEDKDKTDANTNTNTNANTNTNTTSNNGWVLGQDNKWYYYKSGTKVTGWYKDGAIWYYLNEDGTMATGWKYANGTWYYLKESGAMATGWVNDGGAWYYLNEAGAMLSNTTVQGYKLGTNGAWIK